MRLSSFEQQHKIQHLRNLPAPSTYVEHRQKEIAGVVGGRGPGNVKREEGIFSAASEVHFEGCAGCTAGRDISQRRREAALRNDDRRARAAAPARHVHLSGRMRGGRTTGGIFEGRERKAGPPALRKDDKYHGVLDVRRKR